MINLRKEAKEVEKSQFDIFKRIQLEDPSIIIGWQTQDFGKLASTSIDFLLDNIEVQNVAEILPSGFYSFGGVRFKENIVQVPETRLWASEKYNLIILKSEEPEFEHYKFLNTIIDLANHFGRIKEIYTISGTISYIPHTFHRRILAVFNQPFLKESLLELGLQEMTWEGPPAISSYMLWVAKRRGVSGISLWPEIPFYLAGRKDPEAARSIIFFLKRRFNLDIQLSKFDMKIKEWNDRLSRFRNENSEVDQYIQRLEKGLVLDEKEQLRLIKDIEEFLDLNE